MARTVTFLHPAKRARIAASPFVVNEAICSEFTAKCYANGSWFGQERGEKLR